jgi:hypothetical protein
MDTNHISVWGRTLDEYIKMFNLDNLTESTKILSIADGPSTFNLQLRQMGINVTSVDPIYSLTIKELKDVFEKSFLFNKQLFTENPNSFNFKNEKEMKQLLAKRRSTFDSFIIDFEQHRENYHYGKLPSLEFQDNNFDLCVCSNLLFIFDHIFNLDFHIKSIKEMLRLSAEVRIFPLYNIHGEQSECVSGVTRFLTDNSINWEIIQNDYNVYINGNRFLKINR